MSPDLPQSFHGRPHSFPYSVEPTCGVWVSKSHQRPYQKKIQITSSLPNQGQGNLDKVTCQFGTRFGSTFCQISWVMSSLKKFQLPGSSCCQAFPKIPSERRGLGRTDGWMWDAQLWVEWSVHTTAGISKNLLGTNPQSLPEMSKLLQGKMVLCALLSTFRLIPALEISTWHPSKPQADPPEQWCNTVWFFCMAYFRWNMLQDRTTWKNRHTAVFRKWFCSKTRNFFHPLSQGSEVFSNLHFINPFRLTVTIRTIYCKVSVMLSWAPQRVYISILLSITMLDSSSSRSIALIFVVGRFSISGRSWKFGKSERITGSSKCLKRGLGFQLGILSFHSSLTIKNSL